jgi:predicted ATPase
MLIQRLKVSGLLSFGPQGIDLPLGNLNVLIGPNGSGKSNLLEALALLKAAPTNLASPVKGRGGISQWLWQGVGSTHAARVEVDLDYSTWEWVRHAFTFTEHGDRFELTEEQIERYLSTSYMNQPDAELIWDDNEPLPGDAKGVFAYHFQSGVASLLNETEVRMMSRETLKPEESILSQFRDPERYPILRALQEYYPQIEVFRSWSFGPLADIRRLQSIHDRGDFLADGGENLPLVLSEFTSDVKSELLSYLRELYAGIEDYRLAIVGGKVLLYLREQGGREIPATRLSDGTLRYLCLLAILLHPDPPPLIAIEEPELGLHPDIIPQVAKLLVAASERTQLVVTTHSDVLVDALSSQPESVIVCEKVDGESQFRRLEREPLKDWLEKYTLGQLWSMGEIGGNRW